MKQRQFEDLTRSRRNLNWAYNHYDSYDMYRDFVVQRAEGSVFIASTIAQYYYPNHTHIRMDGDEVHFKCDCPYCAVDDACGHVLASILLYEELDIPTTQDFYSYAEFLEAANKKKEEDRLAWEMEMAEIEKNQKLSYGKSIATILDQQLKEQVQEMVHKKMYHLDFELSLEYEKVQKKIVDVGGAIHYKYLDEAVLCLKAKIGSDKMYILKNFRSFFKDIEERNSVSYGKKLEFFHSLDVFEDDTRNLLPSLKTLCEVAEERENVTKIITVYSEWYDYLFNMLKDYPKSYLNWDFDEEEFLLCFEVKKNNDLFELSLVNERNLTLSNNEFYEIEEATLRHLTIESPQLKALASALYDKGSILFEQKDLNSILMLFETENQLEVIGYDAIEDSNVDEISLYIDVENDSLIARPFVIADGKQWNLLDENCPVATKSCKKVKYVLESFASKLTKNAAIMSLHDELTYRFLEEGLLHIEDDTIVYADESLKDIRRPTTLNLSVGVRLNNGLLQVDVDSVQLTKEEIREALMMYRKKRKYYKLRDGEIINLESNDMKELDHLFDVMHLQPKDLDDTTMELPLYRSLQIQSELTHAKELKVKLNEQLLAFNDRFREMTFDDVEVDSRYATILKEYQIYGVKWMLLLAKYGFHGILADDMGLGKTLQVIAMLESDKNRTKPSIVVCPASLLFNWEEELKKFNSNLSHICIYGTKEDRVEKIVNARDCNLIITTYDYLKHDVESYTNIDLSYVIIDEAQYIKNQKTKAARSVKALNGDHRIALTGTPIENSLAELWSIFDFLMPGYLYTYNFFRSNFEIPIVKDEDIDKQKELRSLVEPFILRRTKKGVLKELPEKAEKVLSFQFEEEEEKLYVSKLVEGNEEVSAALNMENPNQMLILKLLGELRQLCCDPRLIYQDYPYISSKMKACIEIVESLVETKQKVLIFSSFTKTLDLIELELKKRNIKYHMLTGSTPKEKRRELVDAFQNDDSIVFLISLKAAGVGLNLTAAEYVIHFDPWWNVAAENQASDRAHRIGQKKNVQVYKLIMKNSVEEKIVKMQERKKDMSDIFIEGSSGSFSSLSKDEILDLFQR